MDKQLIYYVEEVNEILANAVTDCTWSNNALMFETKTGNFAATIPMATNTDAGLMSAQSYLTLYTLQNRFNSLPPAARSVLIQTTSNDATLAFFSGTGVIGTRLYDVVIPSATEDTAGLMSAQDKTALNALKTPRPIIIEIYEAANILNVKQATTESYDAICYNTRTGRLVAKSNLTYYNNWVGADQYGTEMDQNGLKPFVDAFYFCNGNILKYDGAFMWKAAMEIL